MKNSQNKFSNTRVDIDFKYGYTVDLELENEINCVLLCAAPAGQEKAMIVMNSVRLSMLMYSRPPLVTMVIMS